MSATQVVSSNGGAVDESAIREFRSRLSGALLRPGDASYDDGRKLWNGCFDKHPALVARCAGTADVARAIDFARQHELDLAVRAGGHSLGGKSVCDGGLTIDLSLMKAIRVDPQRRIATAQAGLLLGEFDQATQVHGLGTTMGTAPDTGMAGLTLGGGLGWLMGRCGLACDNLLEIEAVTADGRTLRADREENPDLFWGVRGGGANLGVVTSFEFRLQPVGPVLGGSVAYPLARTAEVLRWLDGFLSSTPDDLTIIAGAGLVAGEPALSLTACWSGDLAAAERAMKPMRVITRPLRDSIRPMTYTQMQALLFIAAGIKSYWKSGFVHRLSGDVIETIVSHLAQAPSSSCGFFVETMHGAVCRVRAEDTAFAHRAPGFDFATMSMWEQPAMAEASVQWVRSFWGAMESKCSGVYVNTMGEESDARVRSAYGTNYERLVALKNKYDPANVFRLNQNIKPTA